MKLKFSRKQFVEVQLLREPTAEEKAILLGKNEDATMFDLEGILDWDNEKVIEEDYSYGKPEIVEDV